MLWLALSLPEFPLQSSIGTITDSPVALYETVHGRQIIHTANALARQAGVESGMTLSSAQSLVSALQSIERQLEREAAALQQLAQWAQQFTPIVSLQPPDGLLLEIEASLNIFHGIESLQQAITKALQPLGYSSRQGVAPTPGSAWLLASAEISRPVTDLQQLRSLIPPLPVKLLPISAKDRKTLQTMGIKTIAECLQLPRTGLTQRLGPELLLQIDRLLGDIADPRDIYAAPEQFHSQIMLPDTVHETEPLLFILQRLLHEMSGFLRARNASAQQIQLGLIAPQQPVEYLQLGLLTPSNDPAHLLKLWQEKLDRHTLHAPIEGLELQVSRLLPLETNNLDLFSAQTNQTQNFSQFLERLRNRLGNEAIQQLCCIDEHRPEQACNIRRYKFNGKADKSSPGTQKTERPLWLLPHPQPLKTTAQGPWLDGPLTLLSGPERIESGWWDGEDQRRDYYTARSQQQQKVWIFQQITTPSNWYLHGLF